MVKKQAKKSVTIDQLAMMVQHGFQGVDGKIHGVEGQVQELRKEMHDEIGNVRGKIDDLRNETRLGFKRVDGLLMRIERRLEYEDGEIFEIKDRLKAVEKKVGIKPPR